MTGSPRHRNRCSLDLDPPTRGGPFPRAALGTDLTRRAFLRNLGSVGLAASVCGCRFTGSAAHRPPNVVLIFMDDEGYGDVGVYGAKGFTTPNLDRLASQGMRFTSFYASQAVCSASRAALLTGCYSERVSIRGALFPTARVGLHPQEETIADLLKRRGYATACVGKWHLGHRRPFLPDRQGFDEYFGIPYSNDMWPVDYDGNPATADNKQVKPWKKNCPPLPMYDGNRPVDYLQTLADMDRVTTRYTERAVGFIERHRDRPFFLYLAHTMPHVPLGVSKRFRGKSGYGMYGDVMMETDWSVGRVLDALERNGLEDNTLVIFTSDNGPWLCYGDHAGQAGPLREGKGTALEGGPRVPCIMRWPGRIEAGRVCRSMASTIDLLPTIVAATGAPSPQRRIDGVDISSLFRGDPAVSPREEFLYYYGGQLRGVRQGRFKLVLKHRSASYLGLRRGRNGHPGRMKTIKVPQALYDLEADIGETTDVSAAHPQVVARLEKLAEAARQDLGDRLTRRKGAGVRPCGRIGGPWRDWLTVPLKDE